MTAAREEREDDIVLNYLEAVTGLAAAQGETKRGEELEDIEAQLAAKDELRPTQRLQLLQQRIELRQPAKASDDAARLEAGFVKIALAWAERNGVSTLALREAGAPFVVLQKAGFTRQFSRRTDYEDEDLEPFVDGALIGQCVAVFPTLKTTDYGVAAHRMGVTPWVARRACEVALRRGALVSRRGAFPIRAAENEGAAS